MKKLIAIVFTLILILSVTVETFAEIDLSVMSVNELEELIKEADAEIMNKGGYTILPAGSYVVGQDIAPGSYEVKWYKDTEETKDYLKRHSDENIDRIITINHPGEGTKHKKLNTEDWLKITFREDDDLIVSGFFYIRKSTMIGG